MLFRNFNIYVSSAANLVHVERVSWGGALRDDPNNGCEGDYPRTGLVYFYFLRVNFLVKASTSGDQVWLPWQRYICRSRYGCFCLSPQVTYLHTKIEGGLKFFISNFASLSWRIALKKPRHRRQQERLIFAYLTMKNKSFACFVLAFSIFVHLVGVLVLFTTSNDLF